MWYCTDCGAGFRDVGDGSGLDGALRHSIKFGGALGIHSGFGLTKPPHRGPNDLSIAEEVRKWLHSD